MSVSKADKRPRRFRTGNSETAAVNRPLPVLQAAVGQGLRGVPGGVVGRIVGEGIIEAVADPSGHGHGDGVTDQPPAVAGVPAAQWGRPPGGKPWRRSATSIGGVTTRPLGSSTAGGEGMPSEEPAFRGE